MSSTQKLTKKQKKGLAFRERKTGKGPGKNDLDDMETHPIPFMEDQDQAGFHSDTPEVAGGDGKTKGTATSVTVGNEGKRKEGKVGSKGKGKAEAEDVPVSVEKMSLAKKRKRGDDETGRAEEGGVREGQPKKAPKRKKTDGEAGEAEKKKQRYILFVGNLKYTTTLEVIKDHFASCDPPPTVRLLTPKSSGATASAQRAKSKGCAFLEFTHRNALQQGLKLHQSQLDGRMINVELTAGGGGKGESRISKVRERNKALLEQREERIERESSQDNSFPNLPSKPQRFSATSGLEQKPETKRTWTVGDLDDGETHRGGQRHRERGKSKKPAKAWGTGVNAIPVG